MATIATVGISQLTICFRDVDQIPLRSASKFAMTSAMEAFDGWFVSSEWPDATCPSCGLGNVRADTATEIQTTASTDARDHEAWEPEWLGGFFTCVLRCQRSACREIVIATGLWQVREHDSVYALNYESFYRLQSAVPPLPIVSISSAYPEPVRQALVRASATIWVDPGAAGNRLRLAIELALNAKKIRKTAIAGGKRVRIVAHDRINMLRASNREAADLLEAVKWIGNQATHEDSLSIADVLEAAQILDMALGLLFDPTTDELKRRAMDINKAKRVPKPKKAR